jgi:hypothetical protein
MISKRKKPLLHSDYISIFATKPLILEGNHKYL